MYSRVSATKNRSRRRGISRVWRKSRGEKKRKRKTKRNKAAYTAALVANGWAEAEKVEKQLYDGPTDLRTDRRTEKWVIESRVHDEKEKADT